MPWWIRWIAEVRGAETWAGFGLVYVGATEGSGVGLLGRSTKIFLSLSIYHGAGKPIADSILLAARDYRFQIGRSSWLDGSTLLDSF